MKLISMTDFVLEQHEQCISSTGRTYNYAKFLKQPLTLGMFVPCDLDGNVLEEPKPYNSWLKNWQKEEGFEDCEVYRQAKERCLFEGFNVIGQEEGLFEIELIEKDFWLTFINGKCQIEEDFEIENIEHLLLNSMEDLQLTQTALKLLGL